MPPIVPPECNNCHNHTEHGRRLDHLEKIVNSLAEKVGKLEGEGVKFDERIDRIFSDITGLKDIMRDISSKLDDIIKRPGGKLDKLELIVGTAIVGGIVGYLIRVLFK